VASRLTHVLTAEYVDAINELLVTGGPLDQAEVGRRLAEAAMEALRPTLENFDKLSDENLRLVEARGADAEYIEALTDEIADYRQRVADLDQHQAKMQNELDLWYAKCNEIGASYDSPEDLVRRHREHAATTAKLHAQADIFGLLDAETQDRLREDLAEIAKKRRRAEAESANVVLP
jgi:chromosome segregation ATPase